MGRSPLKARADQLQQLDHNAWTELLRLHTGDRLLTAVGVEAIRRDAQGEHYQIALSGYHDPIALVGRRVGAREAQFYAQLATTAGVPAARCAFSYLDADASWVVLEETPHALPPAEWHAETVAAIVRRLAGLHSLFWQDDRTLRRHWLPDYLAPRRRHAPSDSPDLAGLSEQAAQQVGPLAPVWRAAQAGVRALLELDGWPGVLEEKHLRAAADLLDDPLPLLHPLRQLPPTLIHGYPGIYNWRVDATLDAYHLVDWRQVARGPGVCDLATFLETFGLLLDQQTVYRVREEWPSTEETMVDTYILHLAATLGPAAETHAVRRALPAARCLYLLTHWFPRFHKWFGQLPANPATRRAMWQAVSTPTGAESDTALATVYRPIAGLRPFLAQAFRRFLHAYHQLS